MAKEHREFGLKSLSKVLEGKHFIIESYQRGYKWQQQEVEDLLNDFKAHRKTIKDNKPLYCLQPIVLYPLKDNEFEVIDGQQRLTTLYLLFDYLQRRLQKEEKPYYQISYKTREASAEFLKHHLKTLYLLDNEERWSDFLQKNAEHRFDNVDIYHFFHAYKTIAKFFKQWEEVELEKYYKFLKESIGVIWYQLEQITDNPKDGRSAVYDQFIRLNRGKISLTSGELIKALFILDIKRQEEAKSAHSELVQLKINQFAMEWDQIENRLYDDEFWAFICNDTSNRYQQGTRIDLIFDLIHGVEKNDPYHAYRQYEKDPKKRDWKEVKEYFYAMSDWYRDKRTFHYIGYLNVTGIARLTSSFFEKYHKQKSKEGFTELLKNKILNEFRKIKKNDDDKDGEDFPYSYDNLYNNLDYRDSREAVGQLLLLSNILYYLNDASRGNFPFALYRKNKWSIEHIHPQNPRGFKDDKERKLWLEDVASMLKEKEIGQDGTEYTELIMTINEAIEDKNLKLSEEDLRGIEEQLNIHAIDNLALLDGKTNSHFSNSTFREKQQKMIAIDISGKLNPANENTKKITDNAIKTFIPIGTKNVFLKVHSKNRESVATNFWSSEDRKDYWEFLQTQLDDFFTLEAEQDKNDESK